MANGKNMDYTVTKRQKKFREHMYKAGFKHANVWIMRKEGKQPEKMSMTEFVKQIKELTAGMNAGNLTRLLNLLIKITRGKRKEEKLRDKK
jgi:hypothetical protein